MIKHSLKLCWAYETIRQVPGLATWLPDLRLSLRWPTWAIRKSAPTIPGIPASWPARRSSDCRPRRQTVYQRVTGRAVQTDEDKALASWLWRNTHYAHGEEGAEDLWGKGFTAGGDLRTREYWTGLFAHGFGLCGTTHSQWVAEMDALLGHNRGRGVGVAGHNSFEVFLTGGPYGKGKWALLDHDLSTVIFNADGSAPAVAGRSRKRTGSG